jgi:NAD(P)H-hydrate repair Nnr-like enzyme with NAD(P)H-hydrate epimerase domain
MERAGRAVAEALRRFPNLEFGAGGDGANGGDARIALDLCGRRGAAEGLSAT